MRAPIRLLGVMVSVITIAACTPQAELIPAPPAPPVEEAEPERVAEALQPPPLPRSASIDVPFTPQAPYANWGYPYQEACEEASVIMVNYFLRGEPLSLEQGDAEILKLVAWQTDHGYDQDVTVAQLAEIVRDYYGYETEIIEEVTVDRIKELIAAGNPVVVPAAGRLLGNPYFSGAGPFYHMLVITGYTPRAFITNDPGTKRGERYKYRYDVLINAIHDWTGVKEETHTGKKVMLVVH